MSKLCYYIYLGLGFLLLQHCTTQEHHINGYFVLVESDQAKTYSIGCVPFTKSDYPFRLHFSGEELEIHPAIIKQNKDSHTDTLLGFNATYKLVKDRLLIAPNENVNDTIEYKVIYSSNDSLVLKNTNGQQDYYKRFPNEVRRINKNSFWKIEFEGSANISACFPYKLVLDTSGLVEVNGRNIQLHKKIDKETVESFFKRLNSISEFVIKSDSIEETDSRLIHVKIWIDSDRYLEFDKDVSFYSFEFKKVIMIFDNFVYYNKHESRLISN